MVEQSAGKGFGISIRKFNTRMEGPRLDKRHRLDRPWAKVGGHFPRLRCSWEDYHARLGVKKHKWA
eukprot:1076736-Heterocapsa_arctica.AAC.1